MKWESHKHRHITLNKQGQSHSSLFSPSHMESAKDISALSPGSSSPHLPVYSFPSPTITAIWKVFSVSKLLLILRKEATIPSYWKMRGPRRTYLHTDVPLHSTDWKATPTDDNTAWYLLLQAPVSSSLKMLVSFDAWIEKFILGRGCMCFWYLSFHQHRTKNIQIMFVPTPRWLPNLLILWACKWWQYGNTCLCTASPWTFLIKQNCSLHKILFLELDCGMT